MVFQLQRRAQRQHLNNGVTLLWLLHYGVMAGVGVLIGIGGFSMPAAIADPETTQILLTDPLSFPEDLRSLELGEPLSNGVITANTISQQGLTHPSLWWAREQFGGKLLNNWLVYPESNAFPRIDLVVNQQVWSIYTYAERYAFVNQFGTIARDYGYSMRVFSRDQALLAAYICDDAALIPETASPEASISDRSPDCNLFLNSAGTGALQGRSGLFGGSLSTGRGTAQP